MMCFSLRFPNVFLLVMSGLLILLSACAHHAAAPATAPSVAARPATRPDDPAYFTLDQIQPAVKLAPASRPSQDPPSTAALVLYAKGIDELYQGHWAVAIDPLQEAIKIDPQSFPLYAALGQAMLQRSQSVSDEALASFEQAAALRPDDLQIHLLLARQYFAAKKTAKAIEHLRLAKQTSGYLADAPQSAAVEVFLGRSLQDAGYVRAALDEYQRVSARLVNPTRQLRQDPDIGFIANEPEFIWLQIAQLQEKLGDYPAALKSYEPVARADPANFQLQVRVVQILARLGQGDEAARRTSEIVERFHASPAALAFLRDVSQSVGYDKEIAVLQRLHAQDPADRPILLALVDLLAAHGQAPEARKLLESAGAANPGDLEIVRNLFDFYLAHDDGPAAAKLLIHQLAVHPDSLSQMGPLLAELIRPMRPHPLRLSTLQNLQINPGDEPARLFVISQAAVPWHRPLMLQQSLEQAVKISPPFAPAFRAWVAEEWARAELGDAKKAAACEALAASIEAAAPALASEIRGLSLLNQGNAAGAIDALGRAMQLGATLPEVQLSYATALQQTGRLLDFEQSLWALVAQYPQYDLAWSRLHAFYIPAGKEPEALKSLAGWLKANPASEMARLAEATWHLRHGDRDQGEQGLVAVLADHSDDADLVWGIEQIYARMGKADDFTTQLEKLRAQQPTNLTVVSDLAIIYSQHNRQTDATNLLDQTRQLLAGDADMLYLLASIYHDIGQAPMWEEVLGQVLAADQTNVPASNDLGFAWAEAGKNLDRAEQLIRVAVAAEPDNQAFLDSLGWVLYKRGRFAEAAGYFEQAANPAQNPDPEVLDHFGDVLYRMGRRDDAQKQWQRSLQEMQGNGGEGEALRIRLQVQRKLSDAAAGLPVIVAPLAPTAAPVPAPVPGPTTAPQPGAQSDASPKNN